MLVGRVSQLPAGLSSPCCLLGTGQTVHPRGGRVDMFLRWSRRARTEGGLPCLMALGCSYRRGCQMPCRRGEAYPVLWLWGVTYRGRRQKPCRHLHDPQTRHSALGRPGLSGHDLFFLWTFCTEMCLMAATARLLSPPLA